MKILIVDDEALARARLKAQIDEIGDHQVVAESSSGSEALALCQQHTPDVVLLDIRMPGMDGIELAGHLARLDAPPAVIFTTAYEDHALEAFRLQAVDYLMKPIRSERLQAALANPRLLPRTRLQQLQAAGSGSAQRTHLSVRQHTGVELVPVEEIVFFRAGQKYVSLYYRGRELLIDESLKSLEEEFAGRFLRLHRNALAARSCLTGIQRDSNGHYLAQLRNCDEHLEISRRHLAAVRQVLKERETE